MARIITDYLDSTVRKYPDKTAYIDERRTISFKELQNEAHRLATCLIRKGLFKQPVLVYLDKSVECIAAFEGVSYSGNFYSPLDTKMPKERIDKIVSQLGSAEVITDAAHKDEAGEIFPGSDIIIYEEVLQTEPDTELIRMTTDRIIDTDILYVLFTSGSTGTPKGVIISHRGIVDLAEWQGHALGFSEDTIFGNQSPFYFSGSLYDIYQPLRNGCTTVIIPQILFSQPVKLMQYMEDHEVNTLVWVPSALMFLSAMKALDKPHLSHLDKVYFGAETFQVKHLNRWMDEYPDARFINLYGPTEVSDTCTWFEIDRRFEDDDLIPIGYSCRNKDCFLLDEGKLVTAPEKLGEICMRGGGLAYGYYGNPERTDEAFIQNPLNDKYRELIYCTGDLGKYNDRGELVYVCRKDFQIKHRGQRIELGEIEASVSAIEEIGECCCLYDTKRMRIVLFYTGEINEKDISQELMKKLPEYMVPERYIQLETMPHNLNGKTDRVALKEMIGE